MNILVIGGGGREHALAWKLSNSPRVSRVYVAPGNGGTAQEEGLINLPANNITQWLEAARTHQVKLTVVGPEIPLAEGVVDAFQAAGLPIFGPAKAAAQLESSKIFAKEFMSRHGIPTATWASFDNFSEATGYLGALNQAPVIKVDGLAAGKGVVVTSSMEEAGQVVEQMLVAQRFGQSGQRIIIEQKLQGFELSFIILCSQRQLITLATCQDYKRLFDGDLGPNTGGMGAICPSLRITPDTHRRIMQKVVHPTLAGLQQDGIFYQGFLYFGLMIDEDQEPRVLEFNCRLGDPETQPLMLRMKSDLLEVIEAVMTGSADDFNIVWDHRTAVGVVVAAKGYPGDVSNGEIITINKSLWPDAADAHIFHGGTTLTEGQLRTHGGRVLCVTALGSNLRGARENAYQLLKTVHFPGMQLRGDIGSPVKP